MNILIIIPTYNESENIVDIINAVYRETPEVSVLVIDDNSPDNTYEKVKNLSNERKNLYAIKRPCKSGLASAYIEGFKWGINHNFDIFCEMDADFSHNPAYLKEMIKYIQDCDVVIGSRNIKGGGTEGWSALRNIISKCGSLYSGIILGFPPIYDLTGGFNMWKKEALDKIDLNSVISEGYLFQIEMKYKAFKKGCTLKEIPIIFKDRQKGKSKMNLKIFAEAFVKIWKIKFN